MRSQRGIMNVRFGQASSNKIGGRTVGKLSAYILQLSSTHRF